MRRKFLSVVLCVCMMLTMAPFAFAAEGDKVAKVGSQEYTSLQEAVNAVGSDNGSTVTLLNDVALNSTLVLNNSLTLDLNGHKISNGSSLSGYLMKIEHPSKVSIVGNQKNSSIVDTRNNATGTITAICVFGELTVSGSNLKISRGANGIAIKVDEQSPNQGKLTVNSGTISVDTATTTSSQAIQNWGTTIINGGTFSGDVDSCSYSNIAGQMTINGGTFNGDVYSAQMKYATYEWPTASAQIAIKNGTFNKTIFEDYLDDKNGLQPIQSVAKPDGVMESEVSISGGIFTNDDTNSIANTIAISGGVFKTQVSDSTQKGELYVYPSTNPVAEIGDLGFFNIADAVYAAAENDTITLVADATILNPILVNKSIVLDLNGKTITTKCRQAFEIIAYTGFDGGSLKVTGEGTINANSKIGTFYLSGTESASTATNKKSELVIDKDVKVTNSQYTIWVDVARASEHSCNVNVDISGTIEGEEPLYVNGQIKPDASNVPVIHIGKDARFSMNEVELYLAGYTKTTIEDGATLTNKKGNVITITAGELTINGGTFSGGNTIVKNIAGTGGAITTDTSSAIFIRQHTTRQDLKVTINGGTFTAAVPFYQATGQEDESNKSNVPQPNKVSLSITGGYFASNRSAADGGVAIKSDDKTGFITGGYFNTDPTAHCVSGKTGIPSNDSNYPFTVGTLAAANVDVAPAAPKADADTTKITDDNVKQAMTSAAASAADTSATGLDAIGGNEAKDVTDTEVNNAKTTLSNSGVTVTNKTVTLYVQPYLDITVTGAKVNEQQEATELSLSITPMVKKVASTAKKADDIALANETGKTKNATVISDTEVKNVNTPVTIKLALPNGFAQDKAKLSIKHIKASGDEYYTGIVSTEGSGENLKTYVTFTTNGFSPFVIYAASANVASIGEGENQKVYPSFQEAVNAAQSNDVITLLKSGDVSATMTGSSKTIKVKRADTVSGNVKVTVNSESKTLDNGTAEVTFTYTRPSSGGPGSSGGSISAPTTYAVNVNAATNGAVAADKKTASKGTTVTVTASPSKGYVVDAVKVVDKDGKDVAVTGKDGKYVFTMPASAVTVTGSFKAETPAPVALPFTDVKSGNWFYDAVKYAYAQGLMTGTSATTFAPNGTMNRAMIVTVLYRLEKSPAVTGASKFTDVPAGQWYSDAVAWAAANKIVNGYDETTFGPMNAVTREQMAAILFRYEQVKGLENVTLEENLNRFPDQNKISAYAIPALQWAVGQKIINGNADGTLDPTGTATRAQVAQIFTNLLNK